MPVIFFTYLNFVDFVSGILISNNNDNYILLYLYICFQVIVSMGGQTALNVGIELHRRGVFEQYHCKVLGTSIETIIATEDRELFSAKLLEINETLALSYSAVTVDQAMEVLEFGLGWWKH